jgi:hypothetical protein
LIFEKKRLAKNNYKFKVYPQASIKRGLFLNKFNKGGVRNIFAAGLKAKRRKCGSCEPRIPNDEGADDKRRIRYAESAIPPSVFITPHPADTLRNRRVSAFTAFSKITPANKKSLVTLRICLYTPQTALISDEIWTVQT